MSSPQAKTGVEVERLIGEALSAIETLPKWGPKRLDWKCSKDHAPGELGTDPVIIYVETEDVSPNSVDVLFEADWGTQEDASFIEACSPANIRQLLAALAAERAEAVRLMGDLRASEEAQLELQKANLLLADEAVRMRDKLHSKNSRRCQTATRWAIWSICGQRSATSAQPSVHHKAKGRRNEQPRLSHTQGQQGSGPVVGISNLGPTPKEQASPPTYRLGPARPRKLRMRRRLVAPGS